MRPRQSALPALHRICDHNDDNSDAVALSANPLHQAHEIATASEQTPSSHADALTASKAALQEMYYELVSRNRELELQIEELLRERAQQQL